MDTKRFRKIIAGLIAVTILMYGYCAFIENQSYEKLIINGVITGVIILLLITFAIFPDGKKTK